MVIDTEIRNSDSPLVECVMRGRTEHASVSIRPAEVHWHMVMARMQGNTRCIISGPLTGAGAIDFAPDVELVWIKFKLGTFMPHLLTKQLLNIETALPDASGQSFWLKGSALEFPSYENADTFVERLYHDEVLVNDPLVNAVLQGEPPDASPRTVRHRFLQSVGLTQTDIFQYQRAQQAADLLRQGVSIFDTLDLAGYYDQPHLTRALKHWIGYTPAQLRPPSQP